MKKLLIAASIASASIPLMAKEITIACGSQGIEHQVCVEGVNQWAERTGNKVSVVTTPNTSTDRLAMYQQLLSGQAKDIDVYQIDVIWPGILGSHFIDLSPYVKEQKEQFIPALIQNNTFQNQLVAVPWFADPILNFYRKDLLEKYQRDVPTTYDEMTDTASYIMKMERKSGQDNMWGYVWQGRAYEGLTYNFLEWVQAFNGGNFVETNGDISINNQVAKDALDMAKGWIGTISPEGVLNHAVEDSRGVFQSGNAVFMHNWPYAYNLAQSDDSVIKGKVGVAPMPKGSDDGVHAATLGGWQLAVSRYSDNQDEAADLVMFLTSFQEQKRRAIRSGYGPTRLAVYQDQEVQEASPLFSMMEEIVLNATVRPSTVTGSHYNQVSSHIYNAAHDALSGRKSSKVALEDAEARLQQLSRGGRW
ncbi:ABC transporter substrate-binding protein [Vibrio kyushuensis]|uniref:ABC transporter substrate-binding protein n=1 Tax=Vibrio kyushuensis TaxID=2910249 RepID=UPI003D0E8F38